MQKKEDVSREIRKKKKKYLGNVDQQAQDLALSSKSDLVKLSMLYNIEREKIFNQKLGKSIIKIDEKYTFKNKLGIPVKALTKKEMLSKIGSRYKSQIRTTIKKIMKLNKLTSKKVVLINNLDDKKNKLASDEKQLIQLEEKYETERRHLQNIIEDNYREEQKQQLNRVRGKSKILQELHRDVFKMENDAHLTSKKINADDERQQRVEANLDTRHKEWLKQHRDGILFQKNANDQRVMFSQEQGWRRHNMGQESANERNKLLMSQNKVIAENQAGLMYQGFKHIGEAVSSGLLGLNNNLAAQHSDQMQASANISNQLKQLGTNLNANLGVISAQLNDVVGANKQLLASNQGLRQDIANQFAANRKMQEDLTRQYKQQNDDLMKKMKQPVHGQKAPCPGKCSSSYVYTWDNSCKAYRCNGGTHFMDVNCKDIYRPC